jgi:hypothetical protein
MTTTHAQIQAARNDIAHRCDGPITGFVLICRALEAAAAGTHDPESMANALHIELEQRGYLRPGDDEIPGS